MNDKSALLLPNVDLNNDIIPASTQSLFDHAVTRLITKLYLIWGPC